MTNGMIYLISVIVSFGLIWLTRVNIATKYQRISTWNGYLETATWSELIAITIISLVPVINTGIAFALVLFCSVAIIAALLSDTFSKPLKRKKL